MGFSAADYAIFAAALVGGVLGLFGGFSGALAFLAGVAAAVSAVRFGWGALAARIDAPWLLGLAALAAALVAFGLVRLVVKKAVHGILAQPADAVFGALVASVSGLGLAILAAFALDRLGLVGVDSALLREVVAFVG